MRVACIVCGKKVEAKTARRKYCGPTCSSRASRGAKVSSTNPQKVPDIAPSGPGLLDSVRSELGDLGVVETSVGQQALAMAELIGSSMTGHAALSRELSRLMDEANTLSKRHVNPLDELRERRERSRISA